MFKKEKTTTDYLISAEAAHIVPLPHSDENTLFDLP